MIDLRQRSLTMNRIVKTGYPVENLPEDLRAGLPAGTRVQVTVEGPGLEHQQAGHSLEALFAQVPAGLRLSSQALAEVLDAERDGWGRQS
uniref:hypothetical protein n=2 Tax=Pannonibacter phragmitetus TaxID=121719 RepID=UPI000B978A49|nr:hypothetical protein [Pannonibacter phragmitetus]